MTFNEALKLWNKPEALRLLSFVTGLTATEIILDTERELNETARFLTLIEKRKAHVPLQYLTGRWEFFGLTFITDPRALIPRPETEILTEAVIKHSSGKSLKILDLCAGSGCIAVTLAKMTGAASVTAADISAAALSLAKESADLNGVTAKIDFIESDLFYGLKNEVYDVIVSNPPYIPAGEIEDLQPEVRDYEPRFALDGGADGLNFYRRIIPESVSHLSPGGALFLETGTGSREVIQIMEENGFINIQKTPDYAGFIRVIKGEKPHV